MEKQGNNRPRPVRRLRRHILDWVNRRTARRIHPGDCLLINGFWRSGTTWLMEQAADALPARAVFEPFQARARYIDALLPGIGLDAGDRTAVNALMPYAPPGELPTASPLRTLADQAWRGLLDHPQVRREQERSWAASTGTRTVVKFVRGALSLRSLVDSFMISTIHMTRDPRAVVASILRDPSWGEGAFDALSLRRQLLEPKDGRAAWFGAHAARIEALDRQPVAIRVAAYWALTERFLRDSFADPPVGCFAIVRYEDLVKGGDAAIAAALTSAGCRGMSGSADAAKSSSTSYARSGASNEARVASWRRELDAATAGRIADIAREFALDASLVDDAT